MGSVPLVAGFVSGAENRHQGVHRKGTAPTSVVLRHGKEHPGPVNTVGRRRVDQTERRCEQRAGDNRLRDEDQTGAGGTAGLRGDIPRGPGQPPRGGSSQPLSALHGGRLCRDEPMARI